MLPEADLSSEENIRDIPPQVVIPPAKKPFWQKPGYLSLLVLMVIFLSAISVLLFREKWGDFKSFGYLGAFLFNILGGATIIVPVPALAVVFTLGGLLNPVFVGLAAGLGEAIGALANYLVGYGSQAAVQKKYEAIYFRIQGWLNRRGSLFIFLSASILNPLFTFISASAGALRFPAWKFFLLCWAGKSIKGLTVALLGYWGLRFVLHWLGISP